MKARKQTAQKLHERVVKVLDDDNVEIEQLTEFLTAAAKVLEALHSVEVFEIKDMSEVLPISQNHIRTWSKHPDAPCVWVGERCLWPQQLLYKWLSVPQNRADLSKYRTA